jgi:NADH-quinone oxidoreductase subunit N
MKPLIATAVFAILMMFAALTVKEKKSFTHFAAILMLGLVGLNVWELADYNRLLASAQASPDLFGKMLRVDNYALWFNVLMSSCSFFYILLVGRSIEKVGVHVGEYYALHFFILCGVFLLSTYNNLLILFLGIEILSIPQYILSGSDKRNLKSSEASLKYFLMGAFSTGIMLMGIVLLYGAMGTFDIHGFNFYATGTLNIMGVVGVLFMLVALGFKVSAAPMHFWTPDVYDGSPTPFTAFMATIVKVSVFFAFMRLFMEGFANLDPYWKVTVLGTITVLTLLIGNITAVYQQSVKRMLAYSSIAQAGFMMFVVIGSNAMAMKGMIIYAVAYTLATVGIFGVLLKLKDYTYDGFNGLAKKHPYLALIASICLMSLAGIPLTAGFFAKWFVIAAALEQPGTFWLVIFALAMAAVSLYYYFKVIMAMYFKTGEPELITPVTTMDKVVMAIIGSAVIVFGIAPDMLLAWI